MSNTKHTPIMTVQSETGVELVSKSFQTSRHKPSRREMRRRIVENAAMLRQKRILAVLRDCEKRLADGVEKYFTSFVGDKELLVQVRALLAELDAQP